MAKVVKVTARPGATTLSRLTRALYITRLTSSVEPTRTVLTKAKIMIAWGRPNPVQAAPAALHPELLAASNGVTKLCAKLEPDCSSRS